MASIIIAYILGIFTALIGIRVFKRKPFGVLRVDHSDPNYGPYLFAELFGDIPSLETKDEVVMKVVVKDFIPHN